MLQWLRGTVLTESLDQRFCDVIDSFIVDVGPQGSGNAKLGFNPSRRRLLPTLTNSQQLPTRESRTHYNVQLRTCCEGIVTVGVVTVGISQSLIPTIRRDDVSAEVISRTSERANNS